MTKKQKDDDQTKEDSPKKGFESTYQARKLRTCVSRRMSAHAIMEKLGIKSKQVLKQHVLKLIQEDKVFYEVSGLYEKGTRTVRATSKGELKIGPSVLRAQGITVATGDEFHLSVDGDSIILSRVKDEPLPAESGLESPLMDDSQGASGEVGMPENNQE